MIPNQFTPECYKMHIIAPKTPKDKRKKNENEKKKINKSETFTTKQKEGEFLRNNLI